MRNVDPLTVDGFGAEWSAFDQRAVPKNELAARFGDYFRLFPWHTLPADAVGFDAGCGSGRWAALVAPRVGHLHCFDASGAAVAVARLAVDHLDNCQVAQASLQDMPIADASADFGYSLGVLHHVPDTAAGLRACVEKLKPGAPFLLYLYYAFDNRPLWFRWLWRLSDLLRRGLCRLPERPLRLVTDTVAATVYWPLARLAAGLQRLGLPVDTLPLAYYRGLSFYTMRTDARDRFGTRLERRFTAAEVVALMEGAGLTEIRLSDRPPHWIAVGRRRR